MNSMQWIFPTNRRSPIGQKSDSGRHITSKIPFGYKLDPEDKHKWIIDEPAAETVRVIFRLFNAGKGTTEICRYLTEHKFISPSNHNKQEIKGSRAVADPYYWCVSSVINILDRQEYVGDTVNFKTYHTSFKDKKVRKNSREDYVIIHDTQEPIISREEFEKARKRRNANKRISTKNNFICLTVWYSVAIVKTECTSIARKENQPLHTSISAIGIKKKSFVLHTTFVRTI